MISSIGVDGQIGVGKGLGLDALGGVHDQDGTLAGGQGTGDLIVEVHVARGVDQVQNVVLPVVGAVVEPDGAGLDRDAALAFEVHIVKDLLLHVALFDGVGLLQQAVGQRGLAVVDMGNDGKIPKLG